MKKVLVLVAAMLLVAANAMAFSSVVNSKHNLTTADTSTSTEVCVYCHTPHGADISNVNAPLWNRTFTNVSGYYNSTTLNAVTRPSAVSASVMASDATLCLSCHDGVSVADALVNPPNGFTIDFGTYSIVGQGNLGTNLNNDHPIGMNYATVQAADASGFKATPSLNFYAGAMWCSTCHDVHSDSNYPFLAASNAGSALCLQCHTK
jgi:predicted CXXCH cytochrome family protein